MNVIYILRSISYPVSLQYFAITLFSIWSSSVLFCSSFFNIKCFIVNFNVLHSKYCTIFPVDTGRKLDVHNTFRRRPERLLNFLCLRSCYEHFAIICNLIFIWSSSMLFNFSLFYFSLLPFEYFCFQWQYIVLDINTLKNQLPGGVLYKMCFSKKLVKHLCQSLFFSNVAGKTA